jgi:hypothetical protein
MEKTPMGQTFYREEADAAFPQGCQCGNNGGGDCAWCQIYYDGPTDPLEDAWLDAQWKWEQEH